MLYTVTAETYLTSEVEAEDEDEAISSFREELSSTAYPIGDPLVWLDFSAEPKEEKEDS